MEDPRHGDPRDHQCGTRTRWPLKGSCFKEDFVALCMKRNCQGTKPEHFSAQQVALDVCQCIPTHGLASNGQPLKVWAGPGARAGYPRSWSCYPCEYHKRARRATHRELHFKSPLLQTVLYHVCFHVPHCAFVLTSRLCAVNTTFLLGKPLFTQWLATLLLS